ncbi:unnamed protein product [Dovyalis caffra]|uniref:Uncharacterized protein n=1 Tax=Dovyalis caffra TaxID=77055 RepID=A0AAV1RQD9_9ROSI|nr:unnamed protein product [Dovyalis caffra]
MVQSESVERVMERLFTATETEIKPTTIRGAAAADEEVNCSLESRTSNCEEVMKLGWELSTGIDRQHSTWSEITQTWVFLCPTVSKGCCDALDLCVYYRACVIN